MKPRGAGDLPVLLAPDRSAAERVLAGEIVALLESRPSATLGLATGNSPIGVYRELCAAHAARRVSFASATTFNLDEYLDLPRGDPRSFRSWTQAQLVDAVRPARSRLPEVDPDHLDPRAVAEAYEREIRAAGGLDLVILGIGRNGHIAFNEPGSTRDSRTRVVELDALTRADAARTFGSIESVPRRAITMGIATILEARAIRVLAFGAEKAGIVRRTLEDPVSSAWPATFLRGHRDVRLYVDREAAGAIRDAAGLPRITPS